MLGRLGAYFLSCNRPWAIAGDWNAPPATLRRTGWLDNVRGHLRSPSVNSCEIGKGRIIDYLVISEAMAALMQATSYGLVPPPRHTTPSSVPSGQTTRKRFTCAGSPRRSSQFTPPLGAKENRAPTPGHGPPAPCRQTWREWVRHTEQALCRRLDLFGPEAAQYSGRSLGFRLEQRQLGARTPPPGNKFSRAALAWRSLASITAHVHNLRRSQISATFRCPNCGTHMQTIADANHRPCSGCETSQESTYSCSPCRKILCVKCIQADNLTPIAADLAPSAS